MIIPYFIKRIYWFFQRGYRGYSDKDTWDFDIYLDTIIIGALKQLKKYSHSSEPSQEEYDIMIKGFASNIEMIEDPKKYEELLPVFHKGFNLFKKYFNYFWD